MYYKALPPGLFYVRDNILWCKPAKLPTTSSTGYAYNATTAITEFGDPICICLFPMNSSNILKKSTVYYGSTT